MEQGVLHVSDFVALLNQTLEGAYPYTVVQGELSNFRVSKNRWVYFDLKDEAASLKCFGTVYALPGPLEDGMVVQVVGSPRLHRLYNFSFQVQGITPIGEGTLRKAADLLAAKLQAERLFDESRKRPLPYPPQRVALITAGDSAAYADFVKITQARWGGLTIDHYNVLVQGLDAPAQIVAALQAANGADTLPDVIVLVRGGGSADDLAAWSDERVVRAIAGSRAPTLVGIGHEVDVCLAELAADKRASTPSNAAELLVPDRVEELRHLRSNERLLNDALSSSIIRRRAELAHLVEQLDTTLQHTVVLAVQQLQVNTKLLIAYDPIRPLRQGYAMVKRQDGSVVTTAAQLRPKECVEVKFIDGKVVSQVKNIMLEANERGDV